MIDIFLLRMKSGVYGTFGELRVGTLTLCTVERPRFFNVPSISCIPAGEYIIKLRRYYRGGYPAYKLYDVPERSLIKIHRANLPDDVAGCIGVGLRFGDIDGKYGVRESKIGFNMFMTEMDSKAVARLSIIDEY